MAETVTIDNRLRNKDLSLRSDSLRRRIEDAIHQLANRRTDVVSRELARSEFCRYAVRTAKRNGLKTWSSGLTYTSHDGAMKSLATLLGEKKTCTNGRIYTGTNVKWVLDIWEATLDYYFSDSLLHYLEDRAAKNLPVEVRHPVVDDGVEDEEESRLETLESFIRDVKAGMYTIQGMMEEIDRLVA